MLRWGLDKNSKKLVNIIDAERGIKCNCICPACNATLVAHKAEITHHFKHYRTDECISGIETAIHLKAKEIIFSAKQMTLPSLSAEVTIDGFNGSVSILKTKLILFDEVQLEKKEGKIVPDIIAFHKERKLLIEIAVTHFIDQKKQKIIREQGVSCIEIDLRSLHNTIKNITDTEFEKHVIESTSNKKWIYNTKYATARKNALTQARAAQEKNIEDERNEWEENKKQFNKRTLETLRVNPKVKINENNIKFYDNKNNSINYTINIELYSTLMGFESSPLEFSVKIDVCIDNDHMSFCNIENNEVTVSNIRLESFLKKQIVAISSREGLYNWLNKRAKTTN